MVNISDAIMLLRHLFAAQALRDLDEDWLLSFVRSERD